MISSILKEVKLNYSEECRYYHDWVHLLECLREFDLIKNFVNYPRELEFAIIGHDVIYDTTKLDNEIKSAEYTGELLERLEIPKSVIEKTKRLILVTDHKTKPESIEEKFICDIDLSIFGKDEKTFNEYCGGIKKEYFWVDYDVYAKKRGMVLQSFLDRDKIYYTDFFRDKYERGARENLEREIEKLQEDPLSQVRYFSVRNTKRGAIEFPSRLPCPALMYVPPQKKE